MDWFRHDIYAHLDIKVRKLIRRGGYEAYGVYWFIVELLYENGGEMNVEDLNEELECIDHESMLSTISDLGLLVVSNGKVSSNRILEEIDYQDSCKRKKSAAGKKGMDARYNKESNTQPNSVITEENKCYNSDITVLDSCYNSVMERVITDENLCYNTQPNSVITDSNTDPTIPTNQPTNTNQPKEKNNKKKFVPPTEQEVIQFCTQRQNGVDGKRVYDYYNEAEWHDRNGDPIKNWKQKIIGVWEKNNPTSKQTVCNDPSKMTADMNASGGFDL